MADESSPHEAGADDPRDARDLLPAYALDAVDDVERRAVERLLATDPDARRELDEYRDVVAAFAVESAPPPGLRDAVLARVAASAGTGAAPGTVTGAPSDSGSDEAPRTGTDTSAGEGTGDGVVVDLAAARRARRRRWTGLAAAVAAVVAVAVPTTVAVRATQEQSRLQEQADAIARMLADPDATILHGDVAGGGQASVLAAGDDMYFRASDLPDAGDDRDYQLWVVEADGAVVSAGVLDVHDGSTSRLVQDEPGVGMAVTVEPAGGSEQPTADPVVALVG
ncbi:anti-sigma factor [Cellulosimicrobium sp. SH8]|uniref:anti-sigma factor n=1 Tax=Cellulosimicrobium sp. SH8 TaxID=2952936 RepID=UPI0021F28009|nr:anti-sigma factor [Cellulosimicrobium sp. SH8]